MRKILISLAIIGIVAGVTLGITGAWWTDKAVSKNQSFHSGTLDLKLSNDNSTYANTVYNTWNVDKMAPGGTPYESTLYIKNVGSVNADWLKFAVKNYNPSGLAMDKVMRITKLEYAGKSLLTGGAGADLDSYVAPTTCDITVHPGTYSKITDAIKNAKGGEVICVGPGNYSTSWEGGVIDVNKGVTIASTDGPGSTTISAGIQVSADGVAIKGFTIIPNTVQGEQAGVYFMPTLSNVTVSDNIIQGQGSGRGIVLGLYSGSASYTNVKIENNVIHDLTTGIYTNPHSGVIDIQYNEIYNTVAGIGGLTGANVRYNVFHNNGEAIGADDSYGNSVIEFNNFLGDAVNAYQNASVVAENNWWGDFDPSDQVTGNVDYTPYAGGPFIGYINGKDYNGNGFADLDDFEHSPIIVETPDLQTNGGNYHTLKMGVQLDGPTTDNRYQGKSLGMDMTVTMGQGPVQ